MENYTNGPEMPIGFGMALAQNIDSMTYFSSLSRDAQHSIIEHAHSIKSKEEMQSYAQSLVDHGKMT